MKAICFIIALLSAALITDARSPATENINNSTHPTASAVVETETQQTRAADLPTKQVEPAAVKTEPELKPEPVTQPVQGKQQESLTPVVSQVTPTCAGEVQRYSWNTNVANAVMLAESGNNPDTHNDTPSTGDYSIGCFQINLKGSSNLRAKYRDSVRAGYTGPMTVSGLEQWLKNAKNNVAVAHIMWSDQSWNPWKATTCKLKVKCY